MKPRRPNLREYLENYLLANVEDLREDYNEINGKGVEIEELEKVIKEVFAE